MPKKSTLIISAIGLILLVAIGLFVYFFAFKQSYFQQFDRFPRITSVTKISETNDYEIYKFTLVDASQSIQECKGSSSPVKGSYQLTIPESESIFTIHDTDYKISNYDLSDLSRNIDTELVSENINVKISEYQYCSGPHIKTHEATIDNVYCEVVSDRKAECFMSYSAPTKYSTLSFVPVSGSFTIKFFKKNYQPPIEEDDMPVIIPDEETCPSLNELNCGEGFKEVIETDSDGCEINSCKKITSLPSEENEEDEDENQSQEEKVKISPVLLWSGIAFLVILIILIITLSIRKRK